MPPTLVPPSLACVVRGFFALPKELTVRSPSFVQTVSMMDGLFLPVVIISENVPDDLDPPAGVVLTVPAAAHMPVVICAHFAVASNCAFKRQSKTSSVFD